MNIDLSVSVNIATEYANIVLFSDNYSS